MTQSSQTQTAIKSLTATPKANADVSFFFVFCCYAFMNRKQYQAPLTYQAQNTGQKRPDRSSPPPLRPAAPAQLLSQMDRRAKIIRTKPEQDAC